MRGAAVGGKSEWKRRNEAERRGEREKRTNGKKKGSSNFNLNI